MGSQGSRLLSLVESHPGTSAILVIGTGTTTFLLYHFCKAQGSRLLRLVDSHPGTSTILVTGTGPTVFLVYHLWKANGSRLLSLVESHPGTSIIFVIGTVTSALLLYHFCKAQVSRFLMWVDSHPYTSTILVTSTGTTVFLLYHLWKANGSRFLSLMESYPYKYTVYVIGTGTSVFLLYHFCKAQGLHNSESGEGHITPKKTAAGHKSAGVINLVLSHPAMTTVIFMTAGINIFLLCDCWKTEGACMSSSVRLHSHLIVLAIITAGTDGFLYHNLKEIECREPSSQKEKMQEDIDPGKLSSEREHSEQHSQIDELQKELHQLRNILKQLQSELDWRKVRNKIDDITLDRRTAHPNLSIAGDQKSLTYEAQPQKYPPAPERFDSTVCVLGSEGFSDGKHYWEVDVESSTDWDLGVARKSIARKGKLSLSPKEEIWVLGLSGRDYWAKTDPWTRVIVQKKPKKIGVYLSYEEGQVTFFSVTDMSVLFTFRDCSFSGEVCPFFKNSQKGTTMKICLIKEED
ncbi:uncharacterized protein LOC142823370 isoform X3 [Pelodiscus sinensis]|uniref:uncharacterized protein LOC142823370 isoform X3 n=1 Tax=Pelodiscus sinensis TaxID=13735 RepID=UPI003F6C2769